MSVPGNESQCAEDLSAAKKQRYLTFSERYFTPLYKLSASDDGKLVEETANSDPANKVTELPPPATTPSLTSPSTSALPRDNVKILLHSNGICVLTLAPSHPILTNKLKVSKVDFQVSKKVNRLQNSVRGKGKKGGQFLSDEKQTVAFVSCDDGSVHEIRSGVKGALVEVNDRLVDQPELMTSDPFGQGFLAIVLPRKGERDPQKLNLVTEDEYLREMRKNGVRLFNDSS